MSTTDSYDTVDVPSATDYSTYVVTWGWKNDIHRDVVTAEEHYLGQRSFNLKRNGEKVYECSRDAFRTYSRQQTLPTDVNPNE